MTAAETHTRPRTLSKSDFKLARTCDAKLYFKKNRYLQTGDSDPYLQMLAWGGYMVEALAKAGYPGGIQLEYGSDTVADWEATRRHIEGGDVTLFEATLVHGRRQARVDILQRVGDTLRLIEVKSGSFDGAAHAESLATGGNGVFFTKRKPLRVVEKRVDYVEDITYQVLIAERLFPGMRVEPYLRLVDTSKRIGVSDVPRFFEIIRSTGRDGVSRVHTARFTGDPALLAQFDVISEVAVSAEVDWARPEVEERAARLERLLDAPLTGFTAARGAQCRDCEFNTGDGRSGFRECWGGLADVRPHMLELYSIGRVTAADGSSLVEALLKEGKASLYDIPEEVFVNRDGKVGPLPTRQLRQIQYTKSGEFWMSDELAAQLERVKYPAHFVDFEAVALALPYHAKMRPYGQVAFQWSCHTVSGAGAEPRPGDWLNDDYRWPNERFARALRDCIGDEGSVLTWSSFERTALRNIIVDLATFGTPDPEFTAWISHVAEERIVDMYKWATDHFFHPSMGGKASIKVVLDALWKSDEAMRAQFESWSGLPADPTQDPYAALPPLEINGVLQDVSEGTGAIRAYEAMMYGCEKTDEETKALWRRLLLQYCALDSLSMVLIFEHLRRKCAC